MKFKQGDKVRLIPNHDEGWVEEFGTVLQGETSNGVVTVELDGDYRNSESDDGLREVTPEQLEHRS